MLQLGVLLLQLLDNQLPGRLRHTLHVERQIVALREMGCEFALDDFGTGYSSFSYLQQLHFDYIKIDGTFVEDLLNNPVDQKMIRLIAEIGAEAGMETIAEYVQNAESMALLDELGEPLMSCTLIMPGEELPVTDAEDIRDQLGKQVDLIIDGGPCGLEFTTVVDLTESVPQLIRYGKGSTEGLT